MRIGLRLLTVVVLGTAVVAGLLVGVPVALRSMARHAVSSTAAYLAPLTSATELGSKVYADDGKTVLYTFKDSVTREPIPLSKMAPVLITAVLDTEDHRFFQHGGIDLPSTLRALLSNSAGNGLQGGSDITQQLVKQTYVGSVRKISRKIREAVIANRLQRRYTKDQILDDYLNKIYLGSGAYGVQAAARVYFRRPASRLTLPEAALLAGLIQQPSGYDPVTDPLAARYRREQVLGRMLVYKDITQAQYDAANNSPLPTSATVARTPPLRGIDGYYIQQVESQLLGPDSPLGDTESARYAALFEGGLKIYTNLDPTAQADAEASVLAETPPNTGNYEENLVAIDPTDGAVKAMIAGQDYQPQGFDVVTEGERQPGSGFKLFTLIAGLEAGQSIFDPVDASAPCAIPFPGNDSYVLKPAHNDEGDGQQGVTDILNATAQSLNCAYLRMAHAVGLPAVVSTAEKLGISPREIASYTDIPSMVIGTAEIRPIEIADAYATVAGGGVYHAPSFINHVVDSSGDTIYSQPTTGAQVIPPNVVAEADVALRAVVEDGTGYRAALYGRPLAGKTGTTTGPTDAWFNGFTPQLESTVWMGNPNEATTLDIDGVGVYGGTYPAATVHDFLSAYLADAPVLQFPALDYETLPRPFFIPEVTGKTPAYTYVNGIPTSATTTTTTVPASTTTTKSPSTSTPTTSSPTTTPQTTPTGTTPPTTTATPGGT